jgi:hypothetical protein
MNYLKHFTNGCKNKTEESQAHNTASSNSDLNLFHQNPFLAMFLNMKTTPEVMDGSEIFDTCALLRGLFYDIGYISLLSSDM